MATLTMLPHLSLPAAPDGAPTAIRSRGRDGAVVVAVHSAECARCRAYLTSLADARDDLADWDGRVVVLLPDSLEAAESLREELNLPFSVLADEDGAAADALGIGGGGVIVADQWGEVFHVYETNQADHELPKTDELVEWMRFIAIQCPECQGEAY